MKRALLACAVLGACATPPSEAVRVGPSATTLPPTTSSTTTTTSSTSTTSTTTTRPTTTSTRPAGAAAAPIAAAPAPTVDPDDMPSPQGASTRGLDEDLDRLGDRILGCESGGGPDAPPNWTAENPRSTASGGAQYLDSTWRTEDADGDGRRDSYRGYSRALHAPPAVQEERFRTDLATIGTGPWRSSRSCWA